LACSAVSATGSATTLSSGDARSRSKSVTIQLTLALTSHRDGGVNGVFEIDRVAGRALVPIAGAHAIVAGAHLAQGEPEMSRDRFGFLERHKFVKLSSFGRTMVDELRGMLVARGGGNSRMLATAGTISARRIRIQRMTAVWGGMSAVVLRVS